jgi:hypothetical protein
MADEIVETAEQKLARWAYVIDAQAKEIDRLRAEVARLTEGASAHATLQDIYRNRDLPESLRAKAAQAALPHETPRLMPQPASLDLPCEEVIPLADLVTQRRARMDRILALPLEERSELFSPSRRNSGNGNDSDH